MKKKSQKPQTIEPQEGIPNPSPLFIGNIPLIRDTRTAKRLLSRLIAAFCRGEVIGNNAKTLAYLISVYCQITKDSEFEERLDEVEKQLASKKG